jgi:hypothetical protein
MITCENCGKKTGQDPTGQNWICEDCKVSPEQEATDPPHPKEKLDQSGD